MIRTGSIGLDRALGGGWRPGTLNEIWGDPGAAKTVLALHSAESVSRARGSVVWIDLNDGVRHMDHAPKVIVARLGPAEHVFTIAFEACREPGIKMVVIDPTQRLIRQRELDGDPDYVPHPQREYRQELNTLKVLAEMSGTVVLFVGQPRDKERQPVRGTGISEKVEYRVHLHPDVVHQDGSREIQATVKHVPTKTVTHDAAYFTVFPGKGIDKSWELVHVALKCGVLKERGSWIYYGQVKHQGTAQMAHYLTVNPHLYRQLDAGVRETLGIS